MQHPEADPRITALADSVARVSEWVDSVQIFVTWQEKGETFSASLGAGNSFATLAVVGAWLKEQATVMEPDAGDDAQPSFN